jgi:hypothetical protein
VDRSPPRVSSRPSPSVNSATPFISQAGGEGWSQEQHYFHCLLEEGLTPAEAQAEVGRRFSRKASRRPAEAV